MDPLPDILDQIWAALDEGCARSKHAFHTPTVATVRDGAPTLRAVVLQHVHRDAARLGFHTDRRSPKCRDLEVTPGLAWHFYDDERKVQLRIRGVATLHAEDDVADEAWTTVSALGRRCYGQPLAPGATTQATPVPLPELARLEAEDAAATARCRSNFCAVRCTVSEIEWLHLRFQGHHRAHFARNDDGWAGEWIAP